MSLVRIYQDPNDRDIFYAQFPNGYVTKVEQPALGTEMASVPRGSAQVYPDLNNTWDEGFKIGREEGYDAGYDIGFEMGYEAGSDTQENW